MARKARQLVDRYLCELCHLRRGIRICDRHWACSACAGKYLARLEQERWRA
jgi:ribosomal protein L37AE/L43A